VTAGDRVIDVRMGWEFNRGHVPDARHVGLVRALAGPRLPDGSIIVCESGHRAALVAALRGGLVLEDRMRGWRRAGLPVAAERGGVPLWRPAVVASALSALFTVPHSVEDLTHGIAARVHLSVGAAALGPASSCSCSPLSRSPSAAPARDGCWPRPPAHGSSARWPITVATWWLSTSAAGCRPSS
jgi:rhodanese-related sulfurtransferase